MEMKKTIASLQQTFESSSMATPQWNRHYMTFRTELKALLKKIFNITKFEMSKGHFYSSGFFQLPNGNIWYFSTSDVRWSDKNELLIRTAKDFKDYTGGSNQFARIDHLEEDLRRIVK